LKIRKTALATATSWIQRVPRGAVQGALWLLALLAVETAGPYASSDVGDALAICLLAALASLTTRRLGHSSVRALVRRASRRLATFVERRKVDVGVDYREAPALTRGFPVLFGCAFGGAALLGALAVCLPGELPGDLRATIAPHFYVGYLVLLALLWSALCVGIICTAGFSYMVMHDFLVSFHPRPSQRVLQNEFWLTMSGLAALAVAAFALPNIITVLVAAAALAVAALMAASKRLHPVSLVTRSKDGVARSVPFRWLAATESATFIIAFTGLAFFGARERLLQGDSISSLSMPLTSLLGLSLAWTTTMAATMNGAFQTLVLLMGWRLSHGASDARRLCIQGETSPELRETLKARARRAGYGVRFNRPAEALDVEVRVAPREVVTWPEWPLNVTPRQFEQDAAFERLDQRTTELKRSALIEGLRQVFELVGQFDYEAGEGFLIGIQHWFMLGLARDRDEEDFDPRRDTFLFGHTGPAFARFVPHPARQHFRGVMRALDIDLIFLEDGVRFDQFTLVLEALFEHHDNHAGSVPADDRFFTGITGIRVVIQETGMLEPMRSHEFKEPSYEDIGRARVLHVFKDRGGSSEVASPQPEVDCVPV